MNSNMALYAALVIVLGFPVVAVLGYIVGYVAGLSAARSEPNAAQEGTK